MSKITPPPPPSHLLEAASSSTSSSSTSLPPPPKIHKHPSHEKTKACLDDEALYKLFLNETQDMSADYQSVFQGEQLTVWKKVVQESTVHRIKAKGVLSVACPAELVKQMLWDWGTRLKWDEYIGEAFTVEKYNDHQDVSYFAVNTPIGVTSRDYVQYRSFKYIPEKKAYHMYYKSVELKQAPPRSNRIRGDTLFSGFLIQPSEKNPDICEIIYISQTDVKGYVPKTILNLVAGYAPAKWYKNMNTAITKMKPEYEKGLLNKKP